MSEEDEICGICYDRRDNLRMLPCWHVACMTCILGMTQTGQGRAVTCHECREPCLFENIRSLPMPVRCQICERFLKNPKKFPCCSRLYCSECVSNISSLTGTATCPKYCSSNSYEVQDLPKARICCTCFCLHTDQPSNCGHSVCEQCFREQRGQRSECSLCSAIRNPLPVPINPIQPSWGELGSAMQGMNQQTGQQIDRMQLLSAMQTLRMWQQENPAQQLLQQQQQRPVQNPYTQEKAEKDIPKGIVFILILAVSVYFWGLSYWVWIVCGVSLLLMQPNTIFVLFLCICVNVVLFLISFYYYFWLALALFLTDTFGMIVIRYLGKNICPTGTNNTFDGCIGFVFVLFHIIYCPWIFLHRIVIGFIVQELGKNLSTELRVYWRWMNYLIQQMH